MIIKYDSSRLAAKINIHTNISLCFIVIISSYSMRLRNLFFFFCIAQKNERERRTIPFNSRPTSKKTKINELDESILCNLRKKTNRREREWNLKSIENDKFIELFSPPFSQRMTKKQRQNENLFRWGEKQITKLFSRFSFHFIHFIFYPVSILFLFPLSKCKQAMRKFI